MTDRQQLDDRSQVEDDRDLSERIVDLHADERAKKLRGRLLLRRFWQSAATFWRGAGSRRAWLLTMELLTKQLSETTVISVGHRPELEAFHDRKIVLERRRGGARFVTDIQLISKPRGRLIRNWLGPWRRAA
jgi:ABC-type uncharacterized transport system fused permease/ATPase subunit